MQERNFKIDFVFPFVTTNDEEWIRAYNYWSSSPQSCNSGARFRDFSLLKYIFRSIQTFAPFIDRVFLIVASEKQIPDFIQKDCSKLKIVTHDQFIPKQYLPTFNSNTIEMFVPFIPDLSEHFIYSNDDLIFMKDTDWTDFFVDEEKLRMSYYYSKDYTPINFRYCCKQTWQTVNNLFPKVKMDDRDCSYVKQFHGAASPRLLSDCKECYTRLEDKILDSLTVTRNHSCNLNQYMYGYYSMLKGHSEKIPESYIGEYLDLGTKTLKTVLKTIDDCQTKMLCINDTDRMKLSDIQEVYRALDVTFPKKSIYEI